MKPDLETLATKANACAYEKAELEQFPIQVCQKAAVFAQVAVYMRCAPEVFDDNEKSLHEMAQKDGVNLQKRPYLVMGLEVYKAVKCGQSIADWARLGREAYNEIAIEHGLHLIKSPTITPCENSHEGHSEDGINDKAAGNPTHKNSDASILPPSEKVGKLDANAVNSADFTTAKNEEVSEDASAVEGFKGEGSAPCQQRSTREIHFHGGYRVAGPNELGVKNVAAKADDASHDPAPDGDRENDDAVEVLGTTLTNTPVNEGGLHTDDGKEASGGDGDSGEAGVTDDGEEAGCREPGGEVLGGEVLAGGSASAAGLVKSGRGRPTSNMVEVSIAVSPRAAKLIKRQPPGKRGRMVSDAVETFEDFKIFEALNDLREIKVQQQQLIELLNADEQLSKSERWRLIGGAEDVFSKLKKLLP